VPRDRTIGCARGGGAERKPRDNIEGMAMLVLSRKKNESIVINNDITIVVVEIRGDKVRLGVEAPKEVPVHRREVYDAIRRNVAIGEAETDANGASGDA
jgi:carbon storage regulator